MKQTSEVEEEVLVNNGHELVGDTTKASPATTIVITKNHFDRLKNLALITMVANLLLLFSCAVTVYHKPTTQGGHGLRSLETCDSVTVKTDAIVVRVNPVYRRLVARRHADAAFRRLMGNPDPVDEMTRFLEETEGVPIGSCNSGTVQTNWKHFAGGGTPTQVRFTVDGTTHAFTVGSGVNESEDDDGCHVLRNIHDVGQEFPSYNVKCCPGDDLCAVIESEATRRLKLLDAEQEAAVSHAERVLRSCATNYDCPTGKRCTNSTRTCECFSPLATTMVKGRGPVAMPDIEVGDLVLTGSKGYQPVLYMNHYDRSKPSIFLQIYTENDERMPPLELSSNHMVFLNGIKNPVSAGRVKMGDFLVGIHGPRQVTMVSQVVREGFYAPHTPDGTIVVDGIVASVLSTINGKEEIEIAGLKIHRQAIARALLPVIQALCRSVSPALCKGHVDDGNGGFMNPLQKLGRDFVLGLDSLWITPWLVVLAMAGAMFGTIQLASQKGRGILNKSKMLY